MALQRLQKILAQAGIASRRSAERLITDGRVRVNGRIISELGARANPVRDRVEVDGKRLVAEKPVYYLMHKPRGVVTTLDDPEGRKSVKDLLRGIPERVFPVGRLDFQTSGALLLTNDGAMAQALLHPTRHVPKVYHAKIQGTLDAQRLDLLRGGVTLDDGEHTAPAGVDIVRKDEKHTFIEVTISEGKNRQVHRMLDAVGRVVLRLTRLAFADLAIEGLRPGQLRQLTQPELSDLKEKYLNPSKSVRRARGADPVQVQLPAEDDADVSRARGPDRGRRKPGGARERMRPYVKPARSLADANERKHGFASPARSSMIPARGVRERKDGFVSPARGGRRDVNDGNERSGFVSPARGGRQSASDAVEGKRGFVSPARGGRRDVNDVLERKRGFVSPARGGRRDLNDGLERKRGFVSPARGGRQNVNDAQERKRGFVSPTRGERLDANEGRERKRGFVSPARRIQRTTTDARLKDDAVRGERRARKHPPRRDTASARKQATDQTDRAGQYGQHGRKRKRSP